MSDEIMRAQKRATQNLYVDGSFEFKVGLTLLIVAANTALPGGGNPHGIAGVFVLLASVVLISGGGWLVDRLIRLFKENVTYRRSGYAAPPRKKEPAYPPDTILLFTVFGFFAWVFLVSWGEATLGNNMLVILPALVLFVILITLAIRSGVKHFYFLAAASLGAGLILALLDRGQWSMQMSGVIYFGLVSVLFLFSGAVTLRNYLRNYRPVEDLGFGNEKGG